jgi:hypothetical protein
LSAKTGAESTPPRATLINDSLKAEDDGAHARAVCAALFV